MDRRLTVLAALLLGVVGAHAKDGAPSRLFPYYEEDTGVLRLGQATHVASRQDILGTGTHYQFLLSTGIPDAQITDGRMAVVRVYCCGGSIEEEQAIWVYVAPEITVGAGDIVEVRMGRVPAKDEPGVVNAVVAVRQKSDQENGPCFWQPDNPGLWMRIVYCDGIEKDGWVERKGLRNMWYKPAAAAATDAGAATPASPGSAPASPEAAPAAAPAAAEAALPAAAADSAGADTSLESCFLVSVAAPQREMVRAAAARITPPMQIRFKEEPGADRCDHTLEITFLGEVDRSNQLRNQGGAVAAGPLGMLVGAITPWSCPTTYSATGAVGNHAGEIVGSFQASKKVKRLGTMTMCPDAGGPSEEIAAELVTDVLNQVATAASASVEAPSAPQATETATDAGRGP
jgi:hypothetical protein